MDRIRELFKTLSKAGFGTLFGGGNKLAYQAGGGDASDNPPAVGIETARRFEEGFDEHLGSRLTVEPTNMDELVLNPDDSTREVVARLTSDELVLLDDGGSSVSDAANSPAPELTSIEELKARILVCSTFVQVVEVVRRKGEVLTQAAHQCDRNEQTKLATLWAECVKQPFATPEQSLANLEIMLQWLGCLPEKARSQALGQVKFSVFRLGGDHLNPNLEVLSDCTLVSAPNPPAQQAWKFQLPDGRIVVTHEFKIQIGGASSCYLAVEEE